MKTAGQILQATRIHKRFDLDEVARITKIRPNFIQNIESDDYPSLPSGTVARGFIRNYAEFLGLNPEYILAIFRRDFLENQLGQIIPRGIAQPVARPNLWTPKTTVIFVVSLIFTLFGAYLFYQYRILTGPPPLRLLAPVVGLATDQATVEVEGLTDPEATISVNGELVALEKGGRFYLRVPLSPGSNHITITATAKSQKTTTITRTVDRKT